MKARTLTNDYDLAMPYYGLLLNKFLCNMQKQRAEKKAYSETKKLWRGFKI